MELIGTPMDSIFNAKDTNKSVKLFCDQSTQFTFDLSADTRVSALLMIFLNSSTKTQLEIYKFESLVNLR